MFIENLLFFYFLSELNAISDLVNPHVAEHLTSSHLEKYKLAAHHHKSNAQH